MSVPSRPVMACPRCGEEDERSIGANRCGLCECEFVVGANTYLADYTPVPLALLTDSDDSQ